MFYLRLHAQITISSRVAKYFFLKSFVKTNLGSRRHIFNLNSAAKVLPQITPPMFDFMVHRRSRYMSRAARVFS